MRDPDMGVWAYQYDPNGNLTAQTDARGQTVQYLFDALGRPIETRDGNANWALEKRYYDEAGFGLSKGRRTRAEAYSLPRRKPNGIKLRIMSNYGP